MFPRRRAYPSNWCQVAHVYWCVPLFPLDFSIPLIHCAVCCVIGFVLCTIPKLHYQVLLVATALVGASAVILGVDCFSTAGLKEVRLEYSFHSYHSNLELFLL